MYSITSLRLIFTGWISPWIGEHLFCPHTEMKKKNKNASRCKKAQVDVEFGRCAQESTPGEGQDSPDWVPHTQVGEGGLRAQGEQNSTVGWAPNTSGCGNKCVVVCKHTKEFTYWFNTSWTLYIWKRPRKCVDLPWCVSLPVYTVLNYLWKAIFMIYCSSECSFAVQCLLR